MFETKFDENTKLFSGPDIPPLYNPDISIAHVLLRSMKMFGSKIAQVSDESAIHLTFEELRKLTIRAAQNLQKRGYQSKQVIGFVCENSAFVSPILCASFCLGCPINVLNTLVEKESAFKMFQKTEPSVMFCDVEVYDVVKECMEVLGNEAKIFTFNGTKGDSEPVESLFKETGTEEGFIPVRVDGVNDIAAIMSTSGTTGAYKGVSLSHAVLISEIVSLDVLTSDDILFCSSPLSGIASLLVLLLGTFYGATRIVTSQPSISSEIYLNLIEKHQVTFIICLPLHFTLLLKCEAVSKANLSSLRYILLGGSMIPFSILEKDNVFLPVVFTAYGCTEMGGILTNNSSVHNHSVGRLPRGLSVKIVNEDGIRVGVGVDGEICIKGPFKFLGYYRDQLSTDQVLDKEGFFNTGDIGRFDRDGYLFIVDRKKDLLSFPFYISPSEIESFLIKLPDIKSVCVVGVNYDGYDFPTALVVRSEHSKINEDEIYQLVADNMADRFKLRGGVYFVDEIPSNSNGKILRRIVRETAKTLFEAKRQTFDFRKYLNYKL